MPSLKFSVRLPLLSLITFTAFSGIFAVNAQAQTAQNPIQVTADTQNYNEEQHTLKEQHKKLSTLVKRNK